MKVILFFLFSITILAQNQLLQLTFSEKMDKTTLLNKNNYTVFDDKLNIIPIEKVGVSDSIAVLFLPFLTYKTNYLVRVSNVKDLAGNLIDPQHNSAWFYFNGYDSTLAKPNIFVR